MKKNKYSHLLEGEPYGVKSKNELIRGIRVLKERLKHQNEEVENARDKWRMPGYGKRYFYRMIHERDCTRRQIKGYEDAIERR